MTLQWGPCCSRLRSRFALAWSASRASPSFLYFTCGATAIYRTTHQLTLAVSSQNASCAVADYVVDTDETVYLVDYCRNVIRLSNFTANFTTGGNYQMSGMVATSGTPNAPVLINGFMYISCSDGSINALNKQTGMREKRIPITGAPLVFEYNGYAFATNSGNVVQFEEVFATSSFRNTIAITLGSGSHGMPFITADGLMVLASTSGVYVLDSVSMKPLWNREDVMQCSSPYAYMGVAYAVCGGNLVTFDLYSGEAYMRTWSSAIFQITYVDNTAIMAMSYSVVSVTVPHLHRSQDLLPIVEPVRPLEDNYVGPLDLEQWHYKVGTADAPNITMYLNELVIGYDSLGNIFAISTSTSKLVWKYRFNTTYGLRTSPPIDIIVKGTMVFVGSICNMLVLDARTGAALAFFSSLQVFGRYYSFDVDPDTVYGSHLNRVFLISLPTLRVVLIAEKSLNVRSVILASTNPWTMVLAWGNYIATYDDTFQQRQLVEIESSFAPVLLDGYIYVALLKPAQDTTGTWLTVFGAPVSELADYFAFPSIYSDGPTLVPQSMLLFINQNILTLSLIQKFYDSIFRITTYDVAKGDLAVPPVIVRVSSVCLAQTFFRDSIFFFSPYNGDVKRLNLSTSTVTTARIARFYTDGVSSLIGGGDMLYFAAEHSIFSLAPYNLTTRSQHRTPKDSPNNVVRKIIWNGGPGRGAEAKNGAVVYSDNSGEVGCLLPPERVVSTVKAKATSAISTPMIVSVGSVYFGAGVSAYCLSISTNKYLWNTSALGPDALYGTPVVLGANVYFPDSNGRVFVLNALTGALVATLALPSCLTTSVLFHDGTMMYATCLTFQIYRITAALALEVSPKTVSFVSGVAAFDTTYIYFVDHCGNMYRLAKKSFTASFSTSPNYRVIKALSSGSPCLGYIAGAGLPYGPTLINNFLYIGSADWSVYGVDPDSGTVKWSINTGYSTGQPFTSSGYLYATNSGGYLVRTNLGHSQGEVGDPVKLRVDTSVTASTLGTPAISTDNVMIFATTNGVYAVDGKTLVKLWTQSVVTPCYSPHVYQGLAYVVCQGNLLTFDLYTGEPYMRTASNDIYWSVYVESTAIVPQSFYAASVAVPILYGSSTPVRPEPSQTASPSSRVSLVTFFSLSGPTTLFNASVLRYRPQLEKALSHDVANLYGVADESVSVISLQVSSLDVTCRVRNVPSDIVAATDKAAVTPPLTWLSTSLPLLWSIAQQEGYAAPSITITTFRSAAEDDRGAPGDSSSSSSGSTAVIVVLAIVAVVFAGLAAFFAVKAKGGEPSHAVAEEDTVTSYKPVDVPKEPKKRGKEGAEKEEWEKEMMAEHRVNE